MKKAILLLILLVVVSWSNAQNIKYGAKGGLNLSQFISFKHDISTDIKAGYHLGVLAQMKLNDKFSGLSEIQFSVENTKTESQEFSDYYIRIPIFIQYEVIKNLQLEIGTNISNHIGSEIKNILMIINHGGEKKYTTSTYRDFGFTNNIDIGIGGGLNYLLKSHYLFGARYNLDLYSTKYGSHEMNNSLIQAFFGYVF